MQTGKRHGPECMHLAMLPLGTNLRLWYIFQGEGGIFSPHKSREIVSNAAFLNPKDA